MKKEKYSNDSLHTIPDEIGTAIPFHDLKVTTVATKTLRYSDCNYRTWSKAKIKQLKDSIRKHGLLIPLLVNCAPGRENMVLGGNFRLKILRDLGITEIQVIFINISDLEREREITIKLNKIAGDWDWDELGKLDDAFLVAMGFSSEELDTHRELDSEPEKFDLARELKSLKIDQITIQKGDVYELGIHRVSCGDSTIETDMDRLMNGQKANALVCDPPYVLSYLTGKKRAGKATEGFGFKRDRRYLETESLPDDFTPRWMANVMKHAAEHFHAFVFENWKNTKLIWENLEALGLKIRNLVIYHIPNRVQGFSAKYRLYNKFDIALLASTGDEPLNGEPEPEPLQNEFEAAVHATRGQPHWEFPAKGKMDYPTDVVQFRADDKKHSGQGIIFGTKSLEVMIPFVRILTQRGDIVLEPFGGSGSTLIACEKLHRRCYLMEKVPTYAHVIIHRWEKLTGKKAKKI